MILSELKLFAGLLVMTGAVVVSAARMSYPLFGSGPSDARPTPTSAPPGSPTAAGGREPVKRSGPAALTALKQRLERETRDMKPVPTFELASAATPRSLTVRYKTREYLVYPPNKTGRLAREPEKREGPDDDGCVLRVHLQKKGEVNQLVTPSTITEAYWSTYVSVHPISGSDEQFYFALSTRGLTDKALVARLRGAIAAEAGAPVEKAQIEGPKTP